MGIINFYSEAKDTSPINGSKKAITSGAVYSSLLNYYTKSQVNNLLSTKFTYVVAAQLPSASVDTMYKVYLIPAEDTKQNNIKDEYITIEDNGSYSWEKVGQSNVELDNYYTKQETESTINTAFSEKIILISETDYQSLEDGGLVDPSKIYMIYEEA